MTHRGLSNGFFIKKDLHFRSVKQLSRIGEGAKPLVLPRARNFLYNSRDGFN